MRNIFRVHFVSVIFHETKESDKGNKKTEKNISILQESTMR